MSKDTYFNNPRNSINKMSNTRIVEIKNTDCPLSCPMPAQAIWSAHPRVYLAIEETGSATCPYCGTQYILI